MLVIACIRVHGRYVLAGTVCDTCWFAGIQIVLSDRELECNPACQMLQVYHLHGLLFLSHHSSSFPSFSFDGEMFIFNSLGTRRVKIVNGAQKLWPGCINTWVQCFGCCAYILLEKQWAPSPLPLSSQCVQWGFCCWLERLKHLADSTLRAGENVSAWLSPCLPVQNKREGQVRAGT